MKHEDWLHLINAQLSSWLWELSDPNFMTRVLQYLGREKYRADSVENSSLCSLCRKFNTIDVSINWNMNIIYAIYQGEFPGCSMVLNVKQILLCTWMLLAALFSKLGNGANLDVHQDMTGQRKCIEYIQCHLCNFIIVTKKEK